MNYSRIPIYSIFKGTKVKYDISTCSIYQDYDISIEGKNYKYDISKVLIYFYFSINTIYIPMGLVLYKLTRFSQNTTLIQRKNTNYETFCRYWRGKKYIIPRGLKCIVLYELTRFFQGTNTFLRSIGISLYKEVVNSVSIINYTRVISSKSYVIIFKSQKESLSNLDISNIFSFYLLQIFF